ncbi:MAG: hypothetical protein N2554_05555 [Fimbriimonadales bacterium]|nr:hypothetical protein [Fimbriimonadales bacterium]
MDTIRVSADELNYRYSICSAVKAEQIEYLEGHQVVRVPFYRWDKSKEFLKRHGLFEYEREYPLYMETVEFFHVSEFSLKPEVHLEYYIVEKIRFSPKSKLIVFETDFPMGLRMRVETWNVLLHPSERTIGKYIERARWLVLGEGFSYEIVIYPHSGCP